MSRVLRTVAVVAAVVALSFAIPGVGTAIGAAIGVSITASAAATIAAVASAVSAVAAAGAQMLQKPPDMKGTVNEVVIGANMPVPYVMGRTFVGGMKVYDDSANGTGGSPNKDRTQIFVGTHAGPIDSYEGFYFDYSPIGFSGASFTTSRVATGYYGADGGYLWLNARMGNRPDTALTAFTGRSAFTNWGTSAKLSGMASWSITMEFDEEGERFASGLPAPGMVAKWVKVYDPRLDSTYPGGSGSHRWADESTWAWSANAGLHALTYARGRFMGAGNVKVIGPGIPQQFIDLPAFVELANVCDANGWVMGGAVYEGPGISRWDNLKRILSAAAARPAWVGGMLTVEISSPKVALATITSDDLADGDIEVQAMSSWKDRFNTIVPRYRSEAHRWEYVQADAVVESTYLAEDGESKTDEVQYDLCQSVNLAAQLAAYDLTNRREFGPIRINCKNNCRGLKPGEAVSLDIPEAGLNGQLAVIESRTVDPATGSVALTLRSETTAKHAYALGKTGVAPPTPSIVTPDAVDAAIGGESLAQGMEKVLASSIQGLTFSVSTTGVMTISSHTRVYSDREVTVNGGTAPAPSGVVAGDIVAVFYHDPTRAGGTVTYESIRLPGGVGELPKPSPSLGYYLHAVAAGTVPAAGTTGGGSAVGSGGGGGGNYGGWGRDIA